MLQRCLPCPVFLSRASFRQISSISRTQRTCLYDLHLKHGGKMVPFAGYEMPVQYGNHSIADSSIHTRKHASIFDVSHMMQTHITGKDSIAFIESLTTADVEGLGENQGCLSVFTNDKGGIRDDLIVTKVNEELVYMVTNAGCIEKDFNYLMDNMKKWQRKGKDVDVKKIEGHGLVAVQGPEMITLLESESDIDMSKLYFMHSKIGKVCNIPNCRITRCGYTGEDGVEISVDPKWASEMVERLLQSKKANVLLAGLGARDVLRLEAGLCLYGNDIDENTTPVEGNIAFVIAKRRREKADFPGAEKILSQLKNKDWPKRRVGLISESGRVPRSHLPIIDPINKASVGFVTSGCPSPNLKKNIAMAYVDRLDSNVGKELAVDFGNKMAKVTVAKLPFVSTTYYMAPKN
ncbi:unnamed protein product [Thelazia callipaeda]|uniref:Aminomethyltransferase n=1 Tax=Thelazia callipaeda TaxID=103827 RepID=A0A0N5CRJ6_THECL|nr:unnamed protein product [Thelazia callipaeda]